MYINCVRSHASPWARILGWPRHWLRLLAAEWIEIFSHLTACQGGFQRFFFCFSWRKETIHSRDKLVGLCYFFEGLCHDFFFLKHARIQNLWLLFGLRQAHRATQDPPLLNDLPSELVHVMAVGFPILACKLPNLPFLRVKLWTCFDWIAMNDILKLPTNISVLDQFPCYSFSRFGSDDWNMF